MASVTILDGGMGHHLKQRGVADLITGLPPEKQFLCGAVANVERPDVVVDAHLDFISAGAQVITTNTFALTPWSLKRIQREGSLTQLLEAAAAAANRAVELAQAPCRIAGGLPPLEECYHASRMTDAQLAQGYAKLATVLAPYVDVLCCETLSSAREGAAAARAAAATGKPVWVAWTLRDDVSAKLRGGDSLSTALDAVQDVEGLQAVLVNCCAPQTVTAAMPTLTAWAAARGVACGAYANGFQTTTSEWLAHTAEQGSQEGDVQWVVQPAEQYDEEGVILPAAYAAHAAQWVAQGASLVGGCCGCSPAVVDHLKKIAL